MIEARFNLGDEAVMMHDNKPVKVFVKERLFVKREYISMITGGKEPPFEYVEYEVCTRRGMAIRVNEGQLFKTKEELFKSFGDV